MSDETIRKAPFALTPNGHDTPLSPESHQPDEPPPHEASRSPHASAADSLRAALLTASDRDLALLTADELSRLFNRSELALKERRMQDRQEIFRVTAARLRATDIARSLRAGDETEREAVLRDTRDFLAAIGFRIALEALEQLIRPPEKRNRSRRSAPPHGGGP